MSKRTFEQKVKNILTWVEIINHYWEQHQGNVFNDAEFWDNTLHAMDTRDWWDWVEIEPALKAHYPDSFRRYPYILEGTKYVEKQLMFGKPLVQPMKTSANKYTFRALMNIKDVVNDMRGTPTKTWPKINPNAKQPAWADEPAKNLFGNLFGQGE